MSDDRTPGDDDADRDARMDLSALDPRADQLRFERMVRSTTARAATELTRRAERARASRRPTVLAELARWRRPALAAAAAIAIAALTALRQVSIPWPDDSEGDDTGVAEAAGVPTSFASWVQSGELPDPASLVFNLEDER
jgi:hypothetical protein